MVQIVVERLCRGVLMLYLLIELHIVCVRIRWDCLSRCVLPETCARGIVKQGCA